MLPATEIPETFNVSTAFLDLNLEQGRGDRVALYAGDLAITYRQLLEQVNRAGNALWALGVRPEERVFLLLLDSPEFACLFWGAIRIDAVPVPTNTARRPADYASMLRDSRAGVLAVSEELLPAVEPLCSDLPRLRHVLVAGEGRPGRHALEDLLAAADPDFTPASTHRDEPAFWLWSSGSTTRSSC
jgi:acyl-coenzyme A synthetase/AMP-(fatty) acid ligase